MEETANCLFLCVCACVCVAAAGCVFPRCEARPLRLSLERFGKFRCAKLIYCKFSHKHGVQMSRRGGAGETGRERKDGGEEGCMEGGKKEASQTFRGCLRLARAICSRSSLIQRDGSASINNPRTHPDRRKVHVSVTLKLKAVVTLKRTVFALFIASIVDKKEAETNVTLIPQQGNPSKRNYQNKD